MNELVRSVAGIRGVWGKSLDPEIVVRYAASFGEYIQGGKVIIGRDTRITGDVLKLAAISGLLSKECTVLDIGICPTPTCQLTVKDFEADGGIIITASHNPDEWNGLKFVNSAGEFLNADQYSEFINIVDRERIEYKLPSKQIRYSEDKDLHSKAIENHLDKICEHINVDLIKSKKFKVAYDAVNGAGSTLHLPLMDRLGVEVVKINCLENGIFTRNAEPMPQYLGELCSLVVEVKADIGFAVDPDADRLSIISENGEALGEEMTLPLVAMNRLNQQGGVVVTNLSTSMAIDVVAKKFNSKVVRTKIGEAHVVTGMKENNCIIGGEGNGGVIYPSIHYSRDAGVGIALVLDYMASTGRTISSLASDIPKFYLVKKKINCPVEKLPSVYDYFEKKYSDAKVDRTDGVKINWDDAWLHIRKSGTEGILRVFAETISEIEAENTANIAFEKIKLIIDTQ